MVDWLSLNSKSHIDSSALILLLVGLTGIIAYCLKVWTLRLQFLSLNPSSSMHYLCGQEQVIRPLCASPFSSVKWEK